MIFKPLTAGLVSGTGTIDMGQRSLFGGALIATDGTNQATVTIRENNSSGEIKWELATVSAGAAIMPVEFSADKLYYSISGTGASAQLFEAND